MSTAAKTAERVSEASGSGSPGGGDHHAAGCIAEHVVGRLAEDRARSRVVRQPRRTHDDDLRVSPVGLVDDLSAGVTVADDALDDAHAVEVADVVGLVEQLVGERLLLG